MTTVREEWNRINVILGAAAIAVSGCGAPVGRVGVVHGEVVWDECCEGYLFIRVMNTNTSDSFPSPSQTPTNCALNLATLVEIGILRCAPMMDDNGVPPSAEEQSEFAQTIIQDKSILFHVIKNHRPDWANYPPVLAGWNPLPIQGGCGGGAWQFYIDVALCECGPT